MLVNCFIYLKKKAVYSNPFIVKLKADTFLSRGGKNMVGIVLASHGGFADGIAESAQMLFGEQENFAHVILKPEEGPDDIRGKMEKAIASFDNQDEVLFIVDLWGGTPFNQANGLVEKHADKWAIVSGMNLPMVVEALTQRMSVDSAHKIATAINQLRTVSRPSLKT